MGGALASGLLRRVKPQTGVRGSCGADPNRNLFLIFVSHPRGAVQRSSTDISRIGVSVLLAEITRVSDHPAPALDLGHRHARSLTVLILTSKQFEYVPMNSASLRFIHRDQLESGEYGDCLKFFTQEAPQALVQ
jgi:hypothetical protein